MPAVTPIGNISKVVTAVNLQNTGGTPINPSTNATTPVMYAVAMTSANTEYSQALPANVQKFRIHLRDYSSFRFAYVAGKVATPTDPYETIPTGAEKYEDQLDVVALTLYFASSNAGVTAEIEAWS